MGVHVGWCRRRTSNPVCPAYGGIGGFDSHTLPPNLILTEIKVTVLGYRSTNSNNYIIKPFVIQIFRDNQSRSQFKLL